jgi:hypothetical protein
VLKILVVLKILIMMEVPQRLKPRQVRQITARVELVPFPFVMNL